MVILSVSPALTLNDLVFFVIRCQFAVEIAAILVNKVKFLPEQFNLFHALHQQIGNPLS